MRWRFWRLIILVALTGTLTALVYRRGFGALGARPGVIATGYQTEEAWIAGAVARDVVRMCAYADPRRAARAGESDVTLAPVGGERATFDVRIRVAGAGDAGTIDRQLTLRLPHGLWTPEDYLPVARAVLGNASPVAGAAAAEEPALLDALLDLTPATLAQQDARLSTRLASQMLDPDAQEDAALLVGVFGLREAAGTFSDWRETLSRMTAHLVIARVSRPPGVAYGLSGRYADALRLTFAGRGAEALARIDALDAAGRLRTLATWNRVLRMRVTQDWRVSRDSGSARRETIAERLEFFRARSATIPSPSVLQQLDAEAPGLLGHDHDDADAEAPEASETRDADTSRAPLADWGRIVMHNGVSVQAGNRVVAPRLRAELRELDEIWRVTHGTPRPQALGQALNNGASGCLTSGGPRVLGWGLWARFFQRHLATYLVRADNFYRLTIGAAAAADAEKRTLDALLGGIDLYPVAACWRMHGPRLDENDLSHLPDAIAVTMRAPELIVARNWYLLERGTPYEPLRVGMPRAQAWFMPMSADQPYDVGHRTELERPAVSAAEGDAIAAVSPYDRPFAIWQAGRLAPNANANAKGAKAAPLIRLLHPRADYDVNARYAIEQELHDDDAWRAHRVRTCELATEYCLGLASALVKAGREDEAATLYQRVIDDETVDRVEVSNNSWWLVSYYHRTGQAGKATAVAQAAAEVGSSGGLFTMAWLLEQRQFYDRAAELYEEQADRYNAPQNMIAFYYRMVHVHGVKSYEDQLKASLPRVFPHGLQRFDPASLTIAPKAAVYVMSQTDASRQADVRPADLIVALDGWRTETLQQYETVRAFQAGGDLDLAIWRDGVITRKAKADPYRRLGIELRTFPFNGWSG